MRVSMSRIRQAVLIWLVAAAVPLAAQQPQAAARKDRKAARTAAGAAAVIPPDRADLSYGPHPSQKLDLWLAKSDRPAPLIVFIHGGGFIGGDKKQASAQNVRRALDSGVSYAAINYRFRTEAPIQTVLRDCARAIQFLRANARPFNLDKQRVAAMGGSAGAGTSLWLAFHDDLADAANPDPVLRESTRIKAAAATATQATYDILQWPALLGDAVKQFSSESDWPAFYGLQTAEQLHGPEGKKIRADVDMLGLITKDDAPVYLASSTKNDALKTRGDFNHTSKHAVAVKKRCDEMGVPAVIHIQGNDAPEGDSGPMDFLLKYVTAK
jgi:acetyl esterase